jgi:uncharacterized protein Yka (UPF0111/DUF47 family)
MLRKLIRTMIPSKGGVFFNLFIEAAQNTHQTAETFASIINAKNSADEIKLSCELFQFKQKANAINKNILVELNNQFITPIDRGDIQKLSGLMLKLTKKIIKTNAKLKIYAIDIKTDDCLMSSAITLLNISKILVEIMQALKDENYEKISLAEQQTDEFDGNAIDDLRKAVSEMYSGNYDVMTILKLKEIYKSLESAVDISVAIVDLVMQISIKDM